VSDRYVLKSILEIGLNNTGVQGFLMPAGVATGSHHGHHWPIADHLEAHAANGFGTHPKAAIRLSKRQRSTLPGRTTSPA
jgi:hypothetical protein